MQSRLLLINEVLAMNWQIPETQTLSVMFWLPGHLLQLLVLGCSQTSESAAKLCSLLCLYVVRRK